MTSLTARRVAAVVATCSLCIPAASLAKGPPSSGLAASKVASSQAAGTGYKLTRQLGPARTVVTGVDGSWVATFTDGAFTVTLAGPERVFSERTAGNRVVSRTRVRALDRPFDGNVDVAWLDRARTETSADVLELAMQYIEGAPLLADSGGMRIAGDADYGPMQPDGSRQEGSDFNDYLGVSWTYGATVDAPEASQIASLDCSGFVRMLWGYRTGLPLGLNASASAIPRRAHQMLAGAPGVVTVPNRGRQVTDLARLAPGDLLFFDATADDGPQIDHVGIYLGRDAGGQARFVSSRKTINGPTLGDQAGKSVLDGAGLYAKGLRAIRRL